MTVVAVGPSALVQVMVTVSSNAPANSADVVIVSDPTSRVCTAQLPSSFCVAPSSVQPGGRSFTVAVINAPSSAGLVRPRLIGSLAMPAGKLLPVNCTLVFLLVPLPSPTYPLP